MGFWSNTQDRLVVGRKVEEQLYSQALNELESGVRRDGLWAMALASSEGDDARARAEYISLVVQALKDERHIQRRSPRVAVTRANKQEPRGVIESIFYHIRFAFWVLFWIFSPLFLAAMLSD